MNKSAGVLLGIVVAIGAISAGGAWYTGTKLEGVLNASVVDANKELQTALVGSNGTASLELVSWNVVFSAALLITASRAKAICSVAHRSNCSSSIM